MLFDLGHGVVVLGAFGPVIELRIAECHLERAVPHQPVSYTHLTLPTIYSV